MSVSSGFYNSVNHDRKYNAMHFGQLFDGIIRDGVFMSIGDHFNITTKGTGMNVTVGTGHGWFNRTWITNDAVLVLPISASEILLDRIDAVVIEVDKSLQVRNSSIKVIRGTAADNPSRPTLVKSDTIFQYPLCYVRVNKQVSIISQADITNMIGTSATPFVTGILETIEIDDLVAQWQAEWIRWYSTQQTDLTNFSNSIKNTTNAWVSKFESDMDSWSETEKNDFLNFKNNLEMSMTNWSNEFETDMTEWRDARYVEFATWFRNLQDIMAGDVATNLQVQIDDLNQKVFNYYYDLVSSTGVITMSASGPDGLPTKLVQTSNEATATTTYSTVNTSGTITDTIKTVIVLTGTSLKWTKITEITYTESGTTISIKDSYVNA